MNVALLTIVTTALFAVIALLGTALFQLRASFDGLRNEVAEMRTELSAELAELRGRFDGHLEAHSR